MEEEETRRKFPSLPPNFVSLQMLKERREREQKQREEEEEQRRLEEEERQRLRKEEEAKEIQRLPRVLPRNRAEIGARASSSTRCNRKNYCNLERQRRDLKNEQGDSKSKRHNRESKVFVAVAEAERDESKLKRFNQGSEIAIAVAEQEIVPDLKEKHESIISNKPKRKRYDKKKKKKFEELKAEEIANGDPSKFSAREDGRHAKIQTHQTIASTETTDRHVKTQGITSTSENFNGSNQVSEIAQRVAMISIVDDDRKGSEKHGKIEAKAERTTKAVVVNARTESTRQRPPRRRTAEIEPRIDDRTVDDDPNRIRMNQGRSDSGAVMNGGRWDYRSTSTKFGDWRGNGNLVWVKKEER